MGRRRVRFFFDVLFPWTTAATLAHVRDYYAIELGYLWGYYATRNEANAGDGMEVEDG
jgi:hypothetical protein